MMWLKERMLLGGTLFWFELPQSSPWEKDWKDAIYWGVDAWKQQERKGRKPRKGALTSKWSLKTRGTQSRWELWETEAPGKDSVWGLRGTNKLVCQRFRKHPEEEKVKRGPARQRRWSQCGQSTQGHLTQMSVHTPGCSRHVTVSPTAEFKASCEPPSPGRQIIYLHLPSLSHQGCITELQRQYGRWKHLGLWFRVLMVNFMSQLGLGHRTQIFHQRPAA